MLAGWAPLARARPLVSSRSPETARPWAPEPGPRGTSLTGPGRSVAPMPLRCTVDRWARCRGPIVTLVRRGRTRPTGARSLPHPITPGQRPAQRRGPARPGCRDEPPSGQPGRSTAGRSTATTPKAHSPDGADQPGRSAGRHRERGGLRLLPDPRPSPRDRAWSERSAHHRQGSRHRKHLDGGVDLALCPGRAEPRVRVVLAGCERRQQRRDHDPPRRPGSPPAGAHLDPPRPVHPERPQHRGQQDRHRALPGH